MGNISVIGLQSKPDFIAPALLPSQNILHVINSSNVRLDSLIDGEFSEILRDFKNQSEHEETKKQFDLEFVPEHNIIKNIRELFEVRQQLGKGASCTVLLVAHRKSTPSNIEDAEYKNNNNNILAENINNGDNNNSTAAHDLTHEELYALKELLKTNLSNEELFVQEVNIMKKIQQNEAHPNIVKFIDCYIDDYSYYITLEYVSGGTVLERIIKQNNFSERDAANWIKTILEGVQYIHSLNIVHRDLKADNFIFNSMEENADLKIIDFGHSHEIADEEDDKYMIGGKHYLPPEAFRRQKGWELKKSDMWMIGICCYVLLCGTYPFSGETDAKLFENIRELRFSWPTKIHLSDTCKDFIESLICWDVQQRLSACEALQHPWITGSASDDHLGNDHMHQLKLFAHGNRLQHILVNSMLSAMGTVEKHELHKILTELNLVKNGTLDFAEVIHYMLVNSELKENSFQKRKLDFLGSDAEKSRSSILQFQEDLDINVLLNEIEMDNKSKNIMPNDDTLDFALSVCFPDSVLDSIPLNHSKSLEVQKYEKQLEIATISVETVKSILILSTESYDDIEDIIEQLPKESDQILISDINSFEFVVNLTRSV